MISDILAILPLFVAPLVLFIFTLVSAYVFRFRVAKSGLGFDYVIFSFIIILGLWIGGAI